MGLTVGCRGWQISDQLMNLPPAEIKKKRAITAIAMTLRERPSEICALITRYDFATLVHMLPMNFKNN